MSGVDTITKAGPIAGQKPQRLRVLIVDDNKPFAETLSWVFEGAGDRIEIAHNGPTALEVARRLDPHVVFLDIMLPVMDGIEVCKQIRAQSDNPALRIIALSGFADAAEEADKRHVCFDAYISKPLDLRQVIALLSEMRQTILRQSIVR